jgi:hypothetical protein
LLIEKKTILEISTFKKKKINMKATKMVGYIDTHACDFFSFAGKYHFIPSSFFKLLALLVK